MSNQFHKNLSGQELHVPGYNQGSDPGSIGASMYWYDSTNAVLKIRNLSNGGWDVVRGAFVSSVNPGAVGVGRMWIDTAFGTGGYILRIRNSANTSWETITGGQVPVGGIVFWDKTLMASVGVSTTPWGFVEASGQVLSDSQSILNGKTITNINYGSGTGRYLRGTTGATGVYQANQNASHNHSITVSDPGHAHTSGSLANSAVGDHAHGFHYDTDTHGSGGTNNWKDGGGTANSTDGAGAHNHTISGSVAASATGITATSSLQGGSEARPETITMTALMRVK
jgi:hypothetical protein